MFYIFVHETGLILFTEAEEFIAKFPLDTPVTLAYNVRVWTREQEAEYGVVEFAILPQIKEPK